MISDEIQKQLNKITDPNQALCISMISGITHIIPLGAKIDERRGFIYVYKPLENFPLIISESCIESVTVDIVQVTVKMEE